VGLIDIGTMGAAVAQRLFDAGYPLVASNRTRAKAEPLAARGATPIPSSPPLEEASPPGAGRIAAEMGARVR
jgi:3-hydroxyisobutyrate dehydrogenase-like beta-hydroxyacid dehydrogenase